MDNPIHLLILALATYRLSRLVVEDEITASLRDKIWAKYPPSTKLGYLLTCYWCTSVWISTALIFSYILIPTVTITVALIFALSAVTGIISTRLDR